MARLYRDAARLNVSSFYGFAVSVAGAVSGFMFNVSRSKFNSSIVNRKS
jgi:hypothetical protein